MHVTFSCVMSIKELKIKLFALLMQLMGLFTYLRLNPFGRWLISVSTAGPKAKHQENYFLLAGHSLHGTYV